MFRINMIYSKWQSHEQVNGENFGEQGGKECCLVISLGCHGRVNESALDGPGIIISILDTFVSSI